MAMGQARLPTKSGFEPTTMTDHGWPLGPLLWMALTEHLFNYHGRPWLAIRPIIMAGHGWLLGQPPWPSMSGF